MPQSDSGLIDLIAMDRDARAAEQAQRRAVVETPSAAPMIRDIAVSDDDLDRFAASMSSPWKKISRAKIAMAGGALAVFLVGIAVLTSGGGDDDKAKTAAASAASTSMPAPPAPAIPPPPPVESIKPAAPVAAAPVAAASVASKSKPEKARRSTPARKARSSGPKLTKVMSTGVTP